MKRIHVVAAVIERGSEILIARRPDHVHQGGKWEFPGGKLEADESAQAGLARELDEELGITVNQSQQLIRIAHDYPDKHVLLDVWQVTDFAGEPVGREGQLVRWVTRDALPGHEFPAANVPIVAAARLPATYVISPDCENLEAYVQALEATLASGERLVQIRISPIMQFHWDTLIAHLTQLKSRYGARFLLNSRTAREQGVGFSLPEVFAGMQLTSQDLQALSARPDGVEWLAASCHSPQEIARAEALGLDFVTLSPVRPTPSHPEATPLGDQLFRQWVEAARLPVYGLGGLAAQDVGMLRALGAQGVAGIRGLWKG